MRICILGAGGLGSVLGGWLAETGVDVTLVTRAEHAAAIQDHGLRIDGIRGCRVVKGVTAVTDIDQAKGDFDYLLLTVKARATSTALSEASGVRDRVGVAVSLQNTICKEEELIAWIGADRVIGGSTIEGGVLQAPGTVSHTATAPTTAYFGELDGRPSSRVGALVDVFCAAGFPALESSEIQHVEWEKLLQISIVAGWSASVFGAIGGSVAQGLLVKEAAEHYVQLAQELLGVYRAMGYEPADYYAPFSRFRELRSWTFEQAVEAMMTLGTSMISQGLFGRPSLHDDLLQGRPTEVDYSIGTWLKEAKARGLNTPTVQSVYRIIKSLEYWLVELGGARPILPEIRVPMAEGR
jgi:2-dehydropantoate 2-reductase